MLESRRRSGQMVSTATASPAINRVPTINPPLGGFLGLLFLQSPTLFSGHRSSLRIVGMEEVLLEDLKSRKVPLVFMDVGPARPRVSNIRIDYLHGIRQAV